MAPMPRAASTSLTPGHVIAVGRCIGVQLGAGDGSASDMGLVPVALELTRAPMPQFWAMQTEPPAAGGDSAVGSGTAVGEGDRLVSTPVLLKFVHVQTGEMREGHPLAQMLVPWVQGRRASLRHPKVTDSWAVFARPPPAAATR